jgi:two-component system, cell cycle response regulator
LARLQSSSRVLELERRLSLLAHTDFLTGLLTKRTFFDSLEKEWHRSLRFHLPLSCVMVDLDFFKQINDVYGHPAGDSVLKFVAELLVDNCRVSDTVCRYGGEEFCILMPETYEGEATIWAERAKDLLGALRIPTGEETLRITGSFGIAQFREDGEDPEDLVKQADKALLWAKRSGRDRVVRYTTLPSVTGGKPSCSDHHDEAFEGALARDAMSPLGDCPRPHDSVDHVARLLRHTGVSSTPVLEESRLLVGFVSEKDIMAAMTSPDCWQQPISTVMRPNVICYEEEAPVRVIYAFLCRGTIRGIVITKNGRPTGTVNRGSLLQWFREWVAGNDRRGRASPPHSSPECSMRDMASA